MRRGAVKVLGATPILLPRLKIGSTAISLPSLLPYFISRVRGLREGLRIKGAEAHTQIPRFFFHALVIKIPTLGNKITRRGNKITRRGNKITRRGNKIGNDVVKNKTVS